MKPRRSNPKPSFGYGIFPENEDPNFQPPQEAEPNESSLLRTGGASSEDAVPKTSNLRPTAAMARFGTVGRKGEPLCLAELLALERSHGLVEPDDYDEAYQKLKQSGDTTYLSDLQKMTVPELVAEARKQDIDVTPAGADRRELLFRIIRSRIKENGLMFGEGTLEILPDQFGFLRSPEYHYLSCPDDIYISPSQIRRFGLRKGCTVSGQIRPPKENERYFALLRVEAINHEEPGLLGTRPFFENLTPIHPDTLICLSFEGSPLETRIIDRMVPLGFGQRGLIVSPPRAGKTVLLRRVAESILRNHPEVLVFVLLIDERPEEVTEMVRRLSGPKCEVVCTLFDESPSRHIHVTEIVLEKAKRMVEYGSDVVILLDSITQLGRAWSAETAAKNKPAYEDAEPLNLQAAKKFFGSARNIDQGGSLTILASLFTETGMDIDEAICEQFRGTGNMELCLSRHLAEKRVWPAIDLMKSGTSYEENLLDGEHLAQSAAFRRKIAEMDPIQALNYLADNLPG